MQLEEAGMPAQLDRYIGYWQPYATSHAAFEADTAFQDEVKVAAQTLLGAVRAKRAGRYPAPSDVAPPRQK